MLRSICDYKIFTLCHHSDSVKTHTEEIEVFFITGKKICNILSESKCVHSYLVPKIGHALAQGSLTLELQIQIF